MFYFLTWQVGIIMNLNATNILALKMYKAKTDKNIITKLTSTIIGNNTSILETNRSSKQKQ